LKEKKVLGVRSFGVRIDGGLPTTWWLDKRDCAPVAMEMRFDDESITVEYRYNQQFKIERPKTFGTETPSSPPR